MIKKTVFVLFITIVCVNFSFTQTTHFKFVSGTGSNATLLIPATINPKVVNGALSAGDEIGAFSPRGVCCGAAVWTGADAVITLWQEYVFDTSKCQCKPDTLKGIRPGEKIYFRIWLKSKNREYSNVNFTYAANSMSKDTYVYNGIYILGSLELPNSVNNTNVLLDFRLEQNYPNPFNPATKINFVLPVSDFVTLKVYDINGREVSTPVSRILPAGNHSIDFNAENLQSGVYYYKLQSGKLISTMKMMLMK